MNTTPTPSAGMIRHPWSCGLCGSVGVGAWPNLRHLKAKHRIPTVRAMECAGMRPARRGR